MNGLELLRTIKDNSINDNSIILVYHKGNHIFNMIYSDNEFTSNEDMINISTILDDDYSFNVLSVDDVLDALKYILGEVPNLYDEILREVKKIFKEMRK